MLHRPVVRLIPLLLAPVLLFACELNSDEDETEGFYVETETPEPTPTATSVPTPTREPTPDPHAGYRLLNLTLEDDEGVDLDNDGRVDNDYTAILTELGETITDTFQSTCVTALEALPLPDGTPPPTVVCKGASVTLNQALATLVSLEDFNTNLETAMASADYLARIQPQGESNLAVTYYLGSGSGSEYAIDDTIGQHSGPIQGNGIAKLGPGEFEIILDLEGTPVTIPLEGAFTEMRYAAGVVTDAKVGGVMTEEALVDLLLAAVTGTVPIPEPALEPLSGVLAQIIPDCGTADTVMDNCDDVGGISMGFTYRVEQVQLAD